MTSKSQSVIQFLSAKVVLAGIALWLVGLTMSLLALTDLFTEPLFQRKNAMMLYFNFASSAIVICFAFVYFFAKKSNAADLGNPI